MRRHTCYYMCILHVVYPGQARRFENRGHEPSKKVESSLSPALFVIWQEFFTPHLNTHDRWRRGGGCRDRGREQQKELRRQLRSFGETGAESEPEKGKRADNKKQKNGPSYLDWLDEEKLSKRHVLVRHETVRTQEEGGQERSTPNTKHSHTHTPLGSDIMPCSFDRWMRRPYPVQQTSSGTWRGS